MRISNGDNCLAYIIENRLTAIKCISIITLVNNVVAVRHVMQSLLTWLANLYVVRSGADVFC